MIAAVRGAFPAGALEILKAAAASSAPKRPTFFTPLDGLDISDSGARAGLPLRAARVLGESRLDALVNVAGVFSGDEWNEASWDACMSVNVRGTLRLSRVMAPSMSANGHIVNVTSGRGRLSAHSDAYGRLLASCKGVDDVESLPFLADAQVVDSDAGKTPAYSLSKAALNRGTFLLAKELKVLRVSAVDPGCEMEGPLMRCYKWMVRA